MEPIIKPISDPILDLMRSNKYTIMFSGICKYKGGVYNFYAFNQHYCPDKGYPTKFMLEDQGHTRYFLNIDALECEVIYCPQRTVVEYRYSYN
jgi:hypothetical protein